MYEILVTEPEYLDADGRAALDRIGHVTAKRMTRKELEQVIPNMDAIFIRVDTSVDAALMDKAKKLKIIGSVTTGLNHVDVEAANKRGIKVVNLHGTHTISTAQYTMAMMLSLCRNIPWAYDNVRKGRWERYKFIGTELEGKTLGIIGLGKIGLQVAAYAKAFGMKVVAYDPYAKQGDVPLLDSLDKVLAQADVLTIHAMLTKETNGLFGAKQFNMVKKGAYLVNTARAEIVNQEALLNALNSGQLRGAAFDVFIKEPIDGTDDPMVKYAIEHTNLILTPHIGASTREAAHAACLEIAASIEQELKKV
jgi:D-3-phosphoglycerate dehydrogenase